MYNKLSESEKQYALFADSFLLPCCRKALELEVTYMESYMTSLETAEEEGKIKSVCRGESYPPGFRHCKEGKWPILYPYTDLKEEIYR